MRRRQAENNPRSGSMEPLGDAGLPPASSASWRTYAAARGAGCIVPCRVVSRLHGRGSSRDPRVDKDAALRPWAAPADIGLTQAQFRSSALLQGLIELKDGARYRWRLPKLNPQLPGLSYGSNPGMALAHLAYLLQPFPAADETQ